VRRHGQYVHGVSLLDEKKIRTRFGR
jgi:hypothetical protein